MLALCLASLSQAESGLDLSLDLKPKLGQPAVAGYESAVMPDGRGLPAGAGTVTEGRAVFARECAACHGADGTLAGNALVGGLGTLATSAPVRTVGSYWPYATTLFDYIARAMPYGNEKSLTRDQVYAVVAYVLHLNGIIDADARLDADQLPAVRMPNRDGFEVAPAFAPITEPTDTNE